jgi:hypothetical protein
MKKKYAERDRLALLLPHLSVDDKDEGTAAAEDDFGIKGRVEEVDLAREIPDLPAARLAWAAAFQILEGKRLPPALA